VIWDRRRDSAPLEPNLPPRDLFAELLEHAPVMAILLDAENRVVGANEAARDFFEIEQSRLPASLVEVTLESRLFDVVRLDQAQAEAQLVHHRATVLTS
jgi:PAS domain-containing protein